MKESEIAAAVIRGEHLVVGEFRSGKVEVIKYRDKTTRAAMEFSAIRYNVEFAGEAVKVTERVPEGTQVTPEYIAAWKPPFPKGTAVVLRVVTWVTAKGDTSASGKLESISK